MRELLAYNKNIVLEEKLVLRIKANNDGDIYLPIAGYSSEGLQKCEYGWKVSIDGGEETEYSGVGSENGKIRVGYGLNPLSVHTVKITPIEEDYGWLRAFGYKGTNISSSLINIISDKSYKGYAVKDMFTGDWYKAYQYYGCNNLINTDEELLPDTLQIIGDNYRYYEYAGCTKLVSNAEEKILKTVKAIGDNYRAYQYQNCTAINNINMRAINWASVGENYRKNQYNGVGTDKNQVKIYIEGGIEEGGDWGLNNDNVKGVYVFKDLVSDYQTKLSTITSSKIQKNPAWDNNEYEFIEFIALADSNGEVRIPIGGFSTTMSQDCAYDWMVSIDGGEAVEYSGTGDDSYFTVGSDLVEGSEHKIVIKPKTIGWGWGRAFGYLGTGAQAYIKELIHDSYKCFAVGRLDTGAHYKHGTFAGCTNLINSYEKLPTSVTTIGDYYMKECYAGCTGLETAFWEVLHKDCTVGEDYRHHEYTGCSSLNIYKGIAGYTKGAYPTNYKYEYLAGAGDDMDVYITRKEILPGDVVASMSEAQKGTYTLFTITSDGTYKFNGTLVSSSSFVNGYSVFIRVSKNGTQIAEEYYRYDDAGTRDFSIEFDAYTGDVISFQVAYNGDWIGYCSNIKLIKEKSTIGLVSNKVNKIYCFVNDIYDYKSSAERCDLGDKLEAWYYKYKTHTAIDIDRYTKLVATAEIDTRYTELYPSWQIWGLISVSKISGFPTIMFNADGWAYNSYYIFALLFGLDNFDLKSIEGKEPTRHIIIGTSRSTNPRWGSADMDIEGNIYSGFTYSEVESGVTFKDKRMWTYRQDGITNFVTKVSRNGQFIFTYYRDYKRFVALGGDNYFEDIVDITNIGALNYSLFFSDDGLTMYKANGNNSEILQYSLTTPRDLSTATYSGKSIVNDNAGFYDMSSDGKYLFKYDNGVIYQYTYE